MPPPDPAPLRRAQAESFRSEVAAEAGFAPLLTRCEPPIRVRVEPSEQVSDSLRWRTQSAERKRLQPATPEVWDALHALIRPAAAWLWRSSPCCRGTTWDTRPSIARRLSQDRQWLEKEKHQASAVQMLPPSAYRGCRSSISKSEMDKPMWACTHRSPPGIAAPEGALRPPYELCRSSRKSCPQCPDRHRTCFSNIRSSKPEPAASRACRRPAKKSAPSKDLLQKDRSNSPTQPLFAHDPDPRARKE